MIRFVFSTFVRLFLLFFLVHVVSHWSKVESIFALFERDCDDDCGGRYFHIGKSLMHFATEAGYASMTSLLEVVNFGIFVAKRGAFYVKTRSFYEQYRSEHLLSEQS
jgi:hypothetical protein